MKEQEPVEDWFKKLFWGVWRWFYSIDLNMASLKAMMNTKNRRLRGLPVVFWRFSST
jgi:hypothetical protein